MSTSLSLSRRSVLKTIAAAPLLLTLPISGRVLADGFWEQPRTLHLKRTSNGEEVKATYWRDGRIVDSEYRRLCHLLRDTQANQSTDMHIVLLDIMAGMQGYFRAYGQDRIIMVNSGYRTPWTNANTEGAKKNSLHIKGEASDIWIPNVPVAYLANLAKWLRGGGVGIYPAKKIIHVDRGEIRQWRG